jgi:hypothetical protein
MQLKSFGPIALTLLLLGSLLVIQSGPNVSAAATMSSLSVVSNGKTLSQAALSSGTPGYVSAATGTTGIVITASFSRDATDAPFSNSGTLRYTLDGTPPSGSGAVVRTATDSSAPTSRTFVHTIQPGNVSNAAPGALVQFMWNVCLVGVPSNSCTNFDNGGQFYKFRLDRTVPSLQDLSIPKPAGLTKAVTNSTTPVISFHVRDNAAESRLQRAGFQVSIDGTSRTADFTITNATPTPDHDYRFVFNYPASLTFAPGNHTVAVTARDEALNGVPSFQFDVDQTAPVISQITAVPKSGVLSSGKYVTARGVQVDVRAHVVDHNVPKTPGAGTCTGASPTWPVCARFVNSNGTAPASDFFPLSFDTSVSRWRHPNITIPMTFPATALNLSVEVRAIDGATNSALLKSGGLLVLDPDLPVINDVVPGPYIASGGYVVRANVTDVGAGLDDATVKLHFGLLSGNWTGSPPTLPKDAANLSVATMVRTAGTSNFTYTIPSAKHGANLTWYIEASDKAGAKSTTQFRTTRIDAVAPNVTEIMPRAYRGAKDYGFKFHIVDADVGTISEAVLSWRLKGIGPFEKLNLTAGTNGEFNVTIDSLFADGDNVTYFLEAKDGVGNKANLGTSSSPKYFLVDLTPPTLSISAPSSAVGPRFNVSWTGTDPNLNSGGAGSGVVSYLIQARILRNGTPVADWTTVFNNVNFTSVSVCEQSGFTYEFRGNATDAAGNRGPVTSANATILTGPSCSDAVSLILLSPGMNKPVFDLKKGAGTGQVPLTWRAQSNRTLTPNSALNAKIEFSPDNQEHWFVLDPKHPTVLHDLDRSPVSNSDPLNASSPNGQHVFTTGLPTCSKCYFRIQVSTPTGAQANATSLVFAIVNGDPVVDLDGNGAPDSWEIKYFGRVGNTNLDEDTDGDGLSNRKEAALGTDPFLADSDEDGFSDRIEVKVGTDPLDPESFPTKVQAREEQFTNWYWSVVAVGAVTLCVFLVGLARRW